MVIITLTIFKTTIVIGSTLATRVARVWSNILWSMYLERVVSSLCQITNDRCIRVHWNARDRYV